MEVPTFDVFSGSPERGAMWIAVVSGFDAARKKMEELAAQRPGAYFVFDVRQRSILARIDTTRMVAV